VSGLGTVYVADTLHDRILVFGPRGRLLDEWGTQGGGPLEFRWPTALDSDVAGDIYVADRSNHRVQKLSPTGEYLGEFASMVEAPTGDVTPIGVAAGEHGIFVVHPGINLIRRFTFVE
jgi:DNA-binding beta-propeller fold protein YncE